MYLRVYRRHCELPASTLLSFSLICSSMIGWRYCWTHSIRRSSELGCAARPDCFRLHVRVLAWPVCIVSTCSTYFPPHQLYCILRYLMGSSRLGYHRRNLRKLHHLCELAIAQALRFFFTASQYPCKGHVA